jgi:hypothetical protein
VFVLRAMPRSSRAIFTGAVTPMPEIVPASSLPPCTTPTYT